MLDYFTLLKEGGLYKYIASLVKERDMWSKAYWELTYRRYSNLPTGYKFTEEHLEAYKKWMFGQVEAQMQCRGLKNQVAIQHKYMSKLRTELKQINQHIKKIQEDRLSKLRKLQMVKDPINQEMEEAVAVLETPVHPKLSVITGGKGGGNNWMKTLKPGCIFLCKKKGETEYLCYQFVMDWKGKRGALLSSNVPVKAEVPVDMQAFSNTHELVEVQKEGYDLE